MRTMLRTSPDQPQARHQQWNTRSSPVQYSTTSPSSALVRPAPHRGQKEGASTAWARASSANQDRSANALGVPQGGGVEVELQQQVLLGAVAGEALVDPLDGEVLPLGAELVLLAGEVDPVVRLSDHRQRIA